jgi:hypothetical protein
MFTRPCGPIAGSTKLPAWFAHPHASEEARKIAAICRWLPGFGDRSWVSGCSGIS